MSARTATGRPPRATASRGSGHPAARAPRRLRPPTRAPWWPDAVGVITWSLVLITVALWVSGGGIQAAAGSPADALLSLGRLSGLLSSTTMLLQVLGMARIPWAERSFGQDRLAAWHRWIGFTSFSLLIVHIGAEILGASLADGSSALASGWSILTTYPGMLLATAGTAMVFLVVLTSYRVARRRLRYESWHLLHLYAYLGLALSLPHQLWTGTDFVARPFASAYWLVLYLLALGSVLVFRVARPALLSRRHRLKVSAVVPEVPGAVSVHMTGRQLHRLRVAAGQYFIWRFVTGPGWTRGHPVSLSAVPSDAGLRITVGTDGDDGERIAHLRPGTPVLLEGPYGRMTSQARTRSRIAVFAGGLGLGPLLAILQEHAYDGQPATLVHRLSAGQQVPLQADIDWLIQHAGLRYLQLAGPRSRTGTPWLPEQFGRIRGPLAIRSLVPDLDDHDVYVCGPVPWSAAVVADLHAAGVPPTALHVENFSW